MTQTVLQMVQNAEAELGLPQSVSVFGQSGVTDNTGIQMGALANRVLDELRRMHTWTILQFEFNLLVNPPTTTTGNMVAGSPTITNIASGTGTFTPGNWQVAGAAIPQAARIKSVDSTTQITMNMANTLTGNVTATPLVFSQDTYDIPTGFDWWINRSMWDRTNRWELLGPDSPQMDQWHRSGIVATGPRRHFRFIGDDQYSTVPTGKVRLWPSPAEIVNPLQLVFEYISTAAVDTASGSPSFAQYFTNDGDAGLLDENAMVMGIKWMFWEAKGFGSYVTLQNRWIDYVSRLIARDGAAPTLQLTKRINPIFISPANVQDGFFPGPVGPNMG